MAARLHNIYTLARMGLTDRRALRDQPAPPRPPEDALTEALLHMLRLLPPPPAR